MTRNPESEVGTVDYSSRNLQSNGQSVKYGEKQDRNLQSEIKKKATYNEPITAQHEK